MGTRRIAICVILIMFSGMVIPFANAGDSTDGVISNTSCNIPLDANGDGVPEAVIAGVCDDWDPDDDGTPNHQDWVIGNYQINFLNSETIELVMEWRLHEFARSTLGGIDFDIDGQGDGSAGETMGIPVDYVRNYFNIDADGPGGSADTVSDMVLESARQNVESLASNFGTSNGATTNYVVTVDDIDTGGVVSCSSNPDSDAHSSAGGSNIQPVENAYYPPLCIKSNVTINLDQDKLNFIGNENTNQENY